MIKTATIIMVFSALAFTTLSQDIGNERFYVGTFTSEGAEGLALCKLDTASGEIGLVRFFKAVDNPNYLKKSDDGRFLFVVSRPPAGTGQSGGYVSSYRTGQGGSLEFISKQYSNGDDPCYVDVSRDMKRVVVANYGSGTVSLFPVEDNGLLHPASSVIQHTGPGFDKIRQASAHAHSIRFSRHSEVVYSADLGADKLYAYVADKDNHLVPADQPFVVLPPGSGPRHFDFSSEGKYCYVANELNSTISVLENRADSLSLIQVITTLPAGTTGPNFCADIHLSPDGKQLLVSNRGHNSLAIFRCGDDGKLAPLTHVSTCGNWPRNFVFDPSGKYLLVANQRSHNITLFRMQNGIPVFTGQEMKIAAPVCIEFL